MMANSTGLVRVVKEEGLVDRIRAYAGGHVAKRREVSCR
jgi:hypothetical protein